MKITHLFTHLRALGGVESFIRHHLTHDSEYGLDSNACIMFEKSTEARVVGLGLSGYSTISQARAGFRKNANALAPAIVYHNGWGINMLADIDNAGRRVAVLHSQWGEFENDLKRAGPYLDGCLAVSPQLLEAIHRIVPDLSSRSELLHCPIDSPWEFSQAPLQNRPVRIGYVGRIRLEQKRLDRVPALCRALSESGIRFEFEFLGEGPFQEELSRSLKPWNPLFHGTKRGAEYWNILKTWDFIAFTSDYEGLPISLVEALSVGVLPLYPRIGSGGEDYGLKVHPGCLYTSEKWREPIEFIRSLVGQYPAYVSELRAKAVNTTRAHSPITYHKVFSSFVRRIAEQPRISASAFERRPNSLTDLIPFGALTRLNRDAFFRTAPICRVTKSSQAPLVG